MTISPPYFLSPDEQLLLAGCLAHNRTAQHRLYLQYKTAMFSCALRILNDRALAQEAQTSLFQPMSLPTPAAEAGRSHLARALGELPTAEPAADTWAAIVSQLNADQAIAHALPQLPTHEPADDTWLHVAAWLDRLALPGMLRQPQRRVVYRSLYEAVAPTRLLGQVGVGLQVWRLDFSLRYEQSLTLYSRQLTYQGQTQDFHQHTNQFLLSVGALLYDRNQRWRR